MAYRSEGPTDHEAMTLRDATDAPDHAKHIIRAKDVGLNSTPNAANGPLEFSARLANGSASSAWRISRATINPNSA
eukprot:5729947-Pyramimonas_sp.AAC.1